MARHRLVTPFLRSLLHLGDSTDGQPLRWSDLMAAAKAFAKHVQQHPDDLLVREHLCLSLFELARLRRQEGAETFAHGEAEAAKIGERWPESDSHLRTRSVALYSRVRCLGLPPAQLSSPLAQALQDADELLRRDPGSAPVLALRLEIRTAILAATADAAEKRRLATCMLADAAELEKRKEVDQNALWSRVCALRVFYADPDTPAEQVVANLEAMKADLEQLLRLDPDSDCIHGQIASLAYDLVCALAEVGRPSGQEFRVAMRHIGLSHPEDPLALRALDEFEAGILSELSKEGGRAAPHENDTLFGLVEYARGLALRRRGRSFRPALRRARDLLGRASRADSSIAILHADLALVLTDLGQDAEARLEADLFRKLRPGESATLQAEIARLKRERSRYKG